MALQAMTPHERESLRASRQNSEREWRDRVSWCESQTKMRSPSVFEAQVKVRASISGKQVLYWGHPYRSDGREQWERH